MNILENTGNVTFSCILSWGGRAFFFFFCCQLQLAVLLTWGVVGNTAGGNWLMYMLCTSAMAISLVTFFCKIFQQAIKFYSKLIQNYQLIYNKYLSTIQSFSAEIIIIITICLFLTANMVNYNLTRRFDFLPKSLHWIKL